MSEGWKIIKVVIIRTSSVHFVGHILTSPVASALPTLPFTILKTLFDTTPLTTDDGVLLRRMTLEIGAVHLILACLSVLSHHGPRVPIPGFHQEVGRQAAAHVSNSSMSSVLVLVQVNDYKSEIDAGLL